MTRAGKRTAVIVVFALVGLCLFLSPRASAAPSTANTSSSGASFSWEFQGTCCIWSRTFETTKKAPIIVAAVLEPCATPYGPTEFALELWRGDTFISAKQVTCSGSARWKARRAGTYRFHLIILPPWKDSQEFNGYGTVYHSGAKG